jgi:predicted transglutaminase-like protease
MTADELLEQYQKEVDAIPEMRQLVSYKCETAVIIISNFMAKGYCKNEEFAVLFGDSMRRLKGYANPAVVNDIIEEWRRTD